MLPPIAPIKTHTTQIHGRTLTDNWYWLRDRNDPETLDYLNAENSYTESALAPTKQLQDDLYQEMRSRIPGIDSTVPQPVSPYLYYVKYNENDEYPIHYRRKNTEPEETEEVILNINDLAQEDAYLRIGFVKISPDHRYLAYSLDTSGSESFTIKIKDLHSYLDLADEIPNAYYSFAWASDSATFFYTTLDINHRPMRALRHTLGNDLDEDTIVFEESDPRFFVSVTKSADKEYIFIVSSGNNMSEWYFVKASNPTETLKLITPRKPDFEYYIEHADDHFLIRHNGDNATDFKLSKAPVSNPTVSSWTDVIPHQKGRPLTDLSVFESYYVVSYRELGLPRIKIYQTATGVGHDITPLDTDYDMYVIGETEWASNTLRYGSSSLGRPHCIFDYDMTQRTQILKKQTQVVGEFSESDYVTERLYATTDDNTQVPISLVYRKDTLPSPDTPLYLYGYGSYGINIESEFSSSRLSLLDRGFIFAIAHVRGGTNLGRDWYDDGKLLNKRNTFTDFISAAEHLIATGYTSSNTLIASGGSAGGLLVGAGANLRPNLFKAIVAHVPFVDIINTMLDDSLPLTTMEYNEWGNPTEEKYFDYIYSYSPYDNVSKQSYPNLFVTGGISDPRVTYWEPTKWVASLRHNKTDNNILLLKIDMDSGHSGSSGRFKRLTDVALEYAFLLFCLDEQK